MSQSERNGEYLEFDRKSYHAISAGFGKTELFGEQIDVVGVPDQTVEKLSVQGVFENDHRLLVSHYHPHPGGIRDFFSVLGLTIVAGAFVGGYSRYRLLSE